MAILVQVPSQLYTATTGTPRKVVTPQPLDPSIKRVVLHLTRESWPGDSNTDLISMGFEYSMDGVVWIFNGSATFVGGVVLDRQGQPFLESTLGVGVPNVGVAGRRLRVFVENFQDLTTAITVEAL